MQDPLWGQQTGFSEIHIFFFKWSWSLDLSKEIVVHKIVYILIYLGENSASKYICSSLYDNTYNVYIDIFYGLRSPSREMCFGFVFSIFPLFLATGRKYLTCFRTNHAPWSSNCDLDRFEICKLNQIKLTSSSSTRPKPTLLNL